MLINEVYKGKRVLVTGHTGFKGSWLAIWLRMLGAEVIGYSLNPRSAEDNFTVSGIERDIIDIRADVRNAGELKQVIADYRPEFLFHLAAQPLVLTSYQEPVETYEVNVMGTLNVLEAIRQCGNVRAAIMVTTDKCYENREQIWGYREHDPMGGFDPYSSSKACAELLIASYRNSFFSESNYDKHRTAVASARAGNVVGGGDWSAHRLIPDCLRAIRSEQTIMLRNPASIRPWQHVIEPLFGYLLLGAHLYEIGPRYAQAWNFGPDERNAQEVETIVSYLLSKWEGNSGYSIQSESGAHEAKYLKLDISKARHELKWSPLWNLEETLDRVVEWTKEYDRGSNMLEVCRSQINEYISGLGGH